MKKIDKDRTLRVIFFLYLFLLIRVIIFKYPLEHFMVKIDGWEKGVILEGLKQANFTLFKTIKMYVQYYDRLNSFENLFGNVIAFIPFGILLPLVHRGSKNFFIFLLNTLLLVVGIELFQLFSAFGAFDVDDILLNTLGSIIGYFALLFTGACEQ